MATYLNFRTADAHTVNTADVVKTAGLTNADIDNNFYTVQQKKLNNDGWTKGNLLYANTSGALTSLAIGTENQHLAVSSSGIPTWVTPLAYSTSIEETAFNDISLKLKDSTAVTLSTTNFVGRNGTFIDVDTSTNTVYIESGYSQTEYLIFSTGASTSYTAFVDNGTTGSITYFTAANAALHESLLQIIAGDKIKITSCTGIAAPNNKSYQVLAVVEVSSTEIRIDVDDANVTNINVGTAGNTPALYHWKQHFSGDTWRGDLTVTGNLVINGTTTTLNSTTITVDDKNIELGSVASPTDITADGGGITLKGGTDKTIIWDNTNDNWTSSENWNIASNKSFKINNISVLNATTLGSTVVDSSLTKVGLSTAGFVKSDASGNLSVSGSDLRGEVTQIGSSNTTYLTFGTSSFEVLVDNNAYLTVTTAGGAPGVKNFNNGRFFGMSNGTYTEMLTTSINWKVNYNSVMSLTDAGTLTATDFNSISDIRFKKDLEVITGALEKVNQLNGYTFTLVESGKRSAGLVTQEVYPHLPEVIGGTDEKQTLNYDGTIALLVEAIKELNTKVDTLQNQLNNK